MDILEKYESQSKKPNMKQFAHDLNILGKMTGMSDEQVLEYFKEASPQKMEA